MLLHLNKETTRSDLETDALDSNKTTGNYSALGFSEKHPQREQCSAMKRNTCSNEVLLIVKKKEKRKRSICVHEPKQTQNYSGRFMFCHQSRRDMSRGERFIAG